MIDDIEIRARLAADLLRNELLSEILANMAKDITARWTNAKTLEAREHIWLEQKVARDVVAKINTEISKNNFVKANNARKRNPDAG